MERKITQIQVKEYERYLTREEKSNATVTKYLRDIRAFLLYTGDIVITKEAVIGYKDALQGKYRAASVNSMLAAINGLFSYLGYHELKVKQLKTQRSAFCPKEKELTKAEYERLVAAAKRKKNERLSLLIQTICATGIRVSELKFITVEAASAGRAVVSLKGKTREVFLPSKLRRTLLQYAKRRGIVSGAVFVTKTGRPLDRCNIYHDMKRLCADANVEESKVFPHNLRHLFARTFYSIDKDIAKLADILGHSSIETTRLYLINTGAQHARLIERMGLVA